MTLGACLLVACGSGWHSDQEIVDDPEVQRHCESLCPGAGAVYIVRDHSQPPWGGGKAGKLYCYCACARAGGGVPSEIGLPVYRNDGGPPTAFDMQFERALWRGFAAAYCGK